MIVRSNGVVTYVGKDIANQFWKFGLLGRDFRYRRFADAGRRPYAVGHDVRRRTSPARRRSATRKRIYNVIDSRQMYLQALLSQALRTLGHPTEAENSIHFSYEMVALSHATARELGYETAADGDEARKPFVEVSGRKGLGVKIDDLLDLLTDKAARRSREAQSGVHAARNAQRAGAQIAVAAIRYFMLKFSRGKLIVFDIEEALSFEGETGPYLQYAVVRASNIFHKLQEREALTEADVLASLDTTARRRTHRDVRTTATHDLWALVFEASRLDEVVEQVVRSLEFSGLAKYAFGLAQTVQRVLSSVSDPQRRRRGSEAVARRRRRLRARPADARARPDGHRRPDPDVTHDGRLASPPAANSKTTGRRSCTSAAKPRMLDASMADRRRRSTARRPDADRRRRCRAGALRRSRRMPRSSRREPERDEFEIALVAAARKRNLPILAICRGVQVLNVACGGTLVQDIPSQITGALDAQPGGAAAPAVRARARDLGREGLAAGDADARAAGRRGAARSTAAITRR